MVKLLGLRLCDHDSNISYYDGKTTHYFKSERKYQEKHHGYDNFFDWKQEIKDLWNVDYKDLDHIAIVADKEFDLGVDCQVTKVDHHLAHALSCFPVETTPTQYQIVIDGFGDEMNTWTVSKDYHTVSRGYVGEHGSLGIAMCEASQLLGIHAPMWLDGPGKLMSLQSYGTVDEKYLDKIYKLSIRDINEIFSKEKWIEYCGDELVARSRALDWIATVHSAMVDVLISFFEEVTNNDYMAHISYSGGCALNVVWNSYLKDTFPNLVIPPHCADEGLSLGALKFIARDVELDNFPFVQSDQTTDTVSETTLHTIAKALQQGKIVAWYQGNGELGPRALGHRSILMDPTIPNAKEIINKIKNRENYRPFGASVLEEDSHLYFRFDYKNEHMLYVGTVLDKRLQAVSHVDGTCRFQTVDSKNKNFYNLLQAYKKQTGDSVLLNTSFNIAGKPLMSYTKDALEYFEQSDIDLLVIGDTIYGETA